MAHVIKLNNITLPQPQTWDESYEEVETVNTTEAGTDQISQTRSGKLSISASFNCTSRWYEQFYSLYKLRTVTLMRPEPDSGAQSTRTMRIRSFVASRQLYSGKSQDTEGLWIVSFTLIEF